MSVFHNVVRGAQDGTYPIRWQSCPGRFPSPLGYTKMAFRRLWHAIEVPHAPSSATQSHRRPSARASIKFLRGVGWLPPRHDGASPPMTTTCATSVLGVGGWTLAPSAAHPRVGSTRAPFIWGLCSAVSGCAAHYHTLGAAPEPQHTPYVRAERAWADRTAYILLIRKRPRFRKGSPRSVCGSARTSRFQDGASRVPAPTRQCGVWLPLGHAARTVGVQFDWLALVTKPRHAQWRQRRCVHREHSPR